MFHGNERVKRWEFQAKIFKGGDTDEKARMAQYGKEGWEAFQVILNPRDEKEFIVFFKRELREGQTEKGKP